LPSVISATVPLLRSDGKVAGRLIVRALSGPENAVWLMDATLDPDRDPALEPVQLLEDSEYAYEYELDDSATQVNTDRPEIVSPDFQGHTGRLRTASYTGLLPITFLDGVRELGTASFEVRSRKLDYLKHYRWMLRDLAQEASALVLQNFATSQQRLTADVAGDAATAYERFSLISGLWRDPITQSALRQILAQPHTGWAAIVERRRPGQGLPPGSWLASQLVRGSPRTEWPNSPFPRLTTVPRVIEYERSEATFDTTPNRFVKFVLARWQGLLLDLQAVMEHRSTSASQRRGLREVAQIITEIETVAGEPLFVQIGDLAFFPSSDQVLQKRAGYRDLLRAYMEVEGAVQLTWRGGSDVFAAGQRNVATLYEYWVFIQLLKMMEGICQTVDHSRLLRPTRDGMDLDLRRGEQMAVKGRCYRLGRELELELTFNRIFSGQASWTLEMHPDYSLRINAADDHLVAPSWVHFDAKYKIDRLQELTEPSTDGESPGDANQPKRDDLLKMHAYRDAIRKSVGAYVIFPSTAKAASDSAAFRRYHEMVPSIGAFPLRPSESGDADGQKLLAGFLDGLVTHFASSLTQDRRGRYWESTVFADEPNAAAVGWPGGRRKPPADTRVLLGYVRGEAHMDWIHSTGRYNLRADGRTGSVGLASAELGADLILLYGGAIRIAELWTVSGQPELWTRDQMVAHNYPRQPGAAYLCVRIDQRISDVPSAVSDPAIVEGVRKQLHPNLAPGAPATCTLAALLEGIR
jgi:predicted component of viral defense system (DUF524 family)